MKADGIDTQLSNNIRKFARQIWLAGLGAFARAQGEGGKFFDTLVQEGQVVDVRMKKTAGEQAEQMKNGVEKAMKSKVEEIQGKAAGTWNKLEEVFQARVVRALHRLGVPTRDDSQQLFQQVELLSQNIQELAKVAGTRAKAKKTNVVRSVKANDLTVRAIDPIL